ncbi:hypothetical protein FQN54_000294 [Arachnomyces sp. PD_36]|nr:hypothetical protein FQN54_000294 [Arachnomyces sp. PD_36]
MAYPISVFHAMEQSLPSVPARSTDYQPITTSAASTQQTDPVRILFRLPREVLMDPVSNAMKKLPPISECRATTMPKPEKSHFLKTEGDVLRVSALQLVHPVNLVLEDLFPNLNLQCLSEAVSGRSRTDLKWVLDGSKTVAILEYKNTRVIRAADFEPAITTRELKEQALAKAMEDDKEDPKEEFTLLEDNAIVLTKQVKKYSKICKDIAVFDWHSMCVFETYIDGKPEIAEYTYSCDPQHFRSLLLGMILKGLAKIGKTP